MPIQVQFDGILIDMNEPSVFGTNEEKPFYFKYGDHPDTEPLRCPTEGKDAYLDVPPYPTASIIRGVSILFIFVYFKFFVVCSSHFFVISQQHYYRWKIFVKNSIVTSSASRRKVSALKRCVCLVKRPVVLCMTPTPYMAGQKQ